MKRNAATQNKKNMKTPTLTIAKRKVHSNNLFEAHLNKPAIELINSSKIIFSCIDGKIKLRLPTGRDRGGYKISMHTQKYKKKKYNSSAKFSPVIMNADGVEGKYSIAKNRNSFVLTKIK